MSASHECPEPTCSERVPFGRLACINHWYMVPSALRRALTLAWNDGSPGMNYRQARQDCIDFLAHRKARP